MDLFQLSKVWLVAHTGLARDALHVYVGLIIFFGAAALLRVSLKDWRPLAMVALAIVIGESWDWYDHFSVGGEPYYPDSFKDLWNTLFWPTAIFLMVRYGRIFSR